MFNEPEKELIDLFSNGTADVASIDKCIQRGARISEVIDDTTVLLEIIDNLGNENPPAMEAYVHIIEKGADIHYVKIDGSCALVEAASMHQDVFTDYLLHKGANPNVIIEFHETVLDHAEFDLFFHEGECSDGDPQHTDWAIRMGKIVKSLIRYGAKSLPDLWTDRLGSWLHVFGNYPSGILTDYGNIAADRLPVNEPLKQKIREWKRNYWDSWNDDFGPRPIDFDRATSNELGLNIANDLKAQIPSLVYVKYACVSSKDEARGMRNVDHMDIY